MQALWGVDDIIAVIETLTDEESAYYKSLPTFPRFGKGWLSRVSDREKTATLMATAADTQS
jgi:lysozyme family protein